MMKGNNRREQEWRLHDVDSTAVKHDPCHGKYRAVCLIHKGGEVSTLRWPREKQGAAFSLLTGRRRASNAAPLISLPRRGDLPKTMRTVCMVSNSTNATEVFSSVDRGLDSMWSERASIVSSRTLLIIMQCRRDRPVPKGSVQGGVLLTLQHLHPTLQV